MPVIARKILQAAFLTIVGSPAIAQEMSCTHPDRPNNTYSIKGDQGLFTWDDHDIERAWELKCNVQRDGLSSCHRSENFGDRGASVITFVMLSNGSLVESGYWALLDISRVSVTTGFVCSFAGR